MRCKNHVISCSFILTHMSTISSQNTLTKVSMVFGKRLRNWSDLYFGHTSYIRHLI